jgi:presenilin-like A22 family membrane protease
MEIESWQIVHIIGVFLGLLIGWRFGPWLGVAFILAFVIAVEVFDFERQRKTKKISGEAERHASRA